MIYASNKSDETDFTTINKTVDCGDMGILKLNYFILWTSPDYPSAKVFPISSSPMVSENSVFAFNIDERYVLIGPAYLIYVNSTPEIKPTLL